MGGEAAEAVAQERAALSNIHALLGALERRRRDAAAAADAQQVRASAFWVLACLQHVRPASFYMLLRLL